MPGTARLEAYFQALTSGNRQVFRDLCASVSFETSEVPDGASAVAHYLDSPSYVTAGAKLLSVRNATVEKFSVGYDGALYAAGLGIGITHGVPLTYALQVTGYAYASSGFVGPQNQGIYFPSVGTVQLQLTGPASTFDITYATTLTSSGPVRLTQTWNNGAVTFKALTVDITDTASASGSLLMDLMVGGSSRVNIEKNGKITTTYGVVAGYLSAFGAGLDGTIRVNISGLGLTSSTYALYVTENNGNPILACLDNRRVGVRIASPEADFHAVGTVAGTQLLLGYQGSVDSYFDTAGDLHFRTTASFTDRLTILSGGNVGIGTTSPGAKLDIANGGPVGTPGNQIALTYNTGGFSHYIVSQHSGAAAENYIGFDVYNGLPGVTRTMTLLGNGNVGIGTTSPNALLHISGASGSGIDISNGNYGWWAIRAYSSGSAGTIGFYSNNSSLRPLMLDGVTGTATFGGAVSTFTIVPDDDGTGTLLTSTNHFYFACTTIPYLHINNGGVGVRGNLYLGEYAGDTAHTFSLIDRGTLRLAMTWNSGVTTFGGFRVNVTDTASAAGSLLMDLQVGGTSKFSVDKSSNVLLGPATASYPMLSRYAHGLQLLNGAGGSNSFFTANGCWIGYHANKIEAPTVGFFTDSVDNTATFLQADGAGILAQRNGTNAQAFRIYNTTDGTNAEWAALRWVADYFYLSVNSSGTGVQRDLVLSGSNIYFQAAGPTTWIMSANGHLYCQTNGEYDIGRDAYRVRAFYGGGNTVTASAPVLNITQTWNNGAVDFVGILADFTSTASGAGSLLMELRLGGVSKFNVDKTGTVNGGNYAFFTNFVPAATGAILWNGRASIFSPADGILLLSNSVGADFTRLCFGVYNDVNFPAIERNGSGLRIVLSDASNFANLALGSLDLAGTLKFGTHSALAAETVTGYVTITDAAGNSRKLAVVS